MNEGLINNINSVCTKDDVLFHLGDFAWHSSSAKIEALLNAINPKIKMVYGNHDGRKFKKVVEPFLLKQFPEQEEFVCGDYHRLHHDRRSLVLFHFPIESWHGREHKSIHLHGHVHGQYGKPITGNGRVDVGVDANGLFPISIEEVFNIVDNQEPNKES